MILFAFSFGQSGRLFLSANNAVNINFDKICDGHVQYSIKINGAILFKSIEIEKVCALYLDDGTEIISTPECFIDNSPELIALKVKKAPIGHLFIAGGTWLIGAPFFELANLFNTEDDDLFGYDDSFEYDDSFGYDWPTDGDNYSYTNDKKSSISSWSYYDSLRLGIVLISIGGLLVAVGI